MPTPQKYGEYIQQIPHRDEAEKADIPISHFKKDVAHAIRFVDYLIELKKKTPVYDKGFERHLKAISSLAFFQIVAAFERLLKELAAICVDEVAPLCTDDRLSGFAIRGEDAAPHVLDQTIGRALCESQLWHNIDDVVKRFKKVLADNSEIIKPWKPHEFKLFDVDLKSPSLRGEIKSLKVMFQVRHTIAHNLGTLTRSDAGKLQRILGQRIDSPKELDIDRKHVYYLQQFLSPLATEINQLIADRLGQVLTQFQSTSPSLIDHLGRSKALAKLFQVSFTIAGHTEHP